jgi:thymidylate synthase (FAD)
MNEIFRVRPIAVMQPLPDSGIPNGEDLIAYCARVSNPGNQDNFDTAEGLLDYCRRHAHWSVFEMGEAIVEVEVPRDISRQVLRHRSFNFQEFSQRYSDQFTFTVRDVRRQHPTNRQSSIDDFSPLEKTQFEYDCRALAAMAQDLYDKWRAKGAAKECARVFLPEGLTMSRFYMKGNMRNWFHYLSVREGNGTQLEHQELARAIRACLIPYYAAVIVERSGDG